ncbi:MAG TPA: GxxExxY protein [Rhizomicrobium sp.]|jgi:iron complex transport system substrate-binding protein
MDLARRGAEDADNRESPLNRITGAIVSSAFRLHKDLGPGLLESVYEAILARDLARRGFHVERQRSSSFEYDGLPFKDAFRLDLLVEHCVVVEIKSVENVHPVHAKQVLSYLRLLRLPVGLLINFGAPYLRDGLTRLVNTRVPAPQRLCANPSPVPIPPQGPQDL